MKARTIGIGFATALALAVPGGAAGQEPAGSVVPPENSAATQYTEALPTAGGDKEAGDGGRKPAPAKVLGAKNAKRLESHGEDGRQVAEIVVETAPAPSGGRQGTPPPQPATVGSDRSAEDGGESDAVGGKADGRSGGPSATDGTARPETPSPGRAATSTELPSGSSGFGEVLAEATGSSSSGQLGALLPLAILAAIAWALAFLWRQRRPVE